MSQGKGARPGSTLDDFLAEVDILEEATEHAVKSVRALQIGEAMQARNLSKVAMAREMQTSRTQLDRLLDPDNNSVTLHRAAAVLGKRLRVDLV